MPFGVADLHSSHCCLVQGYPPFYSWWWIGCLFASKSPPPSSSYAIEKRLISLLNTSVTEPQWFSSLVNTESHIKTYCAVLYTTSPWLLLTCLSAVIQAIAVAVRPSCIITRLSLIHLLRTKWTNRTLPTNEQYSLIIIHTLINKHWTSRPNTTNNIKWRRL